MYFMETHVYICDTFYVEVRVAIIKIQAQTLSE